MSLLKDWEQSPSLLDQMWNWLPIAKPPLSRVKPTIIKKPILQVDLPIILKTMIHDNFCKLKIELKNVLWSFSNRYIVANQLNLNIIMQPVSTQSII